MLTPEEFLGPSISHGYCAPCPVSSDEWLRWSLFGRHFRFPKAVWEICKPRYSQARLQGTRGQTRALFKPGLKKAGISARCATQRGIRSTVPSLAENLPRTTSTLIQDANIIITHSRFRDDFHLNRYTILCKIIPSLFVYFVVNS